MYGSKSEAMHPLGLLTEEPAEVLFQGNFNASIISTGKEGEL